MRSLKGERNRPPPGSRSPRARDHPWCWNRAATGLSSRARRAGLRLEPRLARSCGRARALPCRAHRDLRRRGSGPSLMCPSMMAQRAIEPVDTQTKRTGLGAIENEWHELLPSSVPRPLSQRRGFAGFEAFFSFLAGLVAFLFRPAGRGKLEHRDTPPVRSATRPTAAGRARRQPARHCAARWTRSASRRTTSILCSTSRMVLSPSRLNRLDEVEDHRHPRRRSSPRSASSNMKISGSSASRIATSSLRWSPCGSGRRACRPHAHRA